MWQLRLYGLHGLTKIKRKFKAMNSLKLFSLVAVFPIRLFLGLLYEADSFQKDCLIQFVKYLHKHTKSNIKKYEDLTTESHRTKSLAKFAGNVRVYKIVFKSCSCFFTQKHITKSSNTFCFKFWSVKKLWCIKPSCFLGWVIYICEIEAWFYTLKTPSVKKRCFPARAQVQRQI